jgi:hypothetical protein
MNTVLVWILVTVNSTYYGYKTVTYSPPLADLESCQRLADNVRMDVDRSITTQCVQVRVVK